MKSETEWKTQLVGQWKAAGGYGRRIEDSFGVGFPDMVLRNDGFAPAFVEAKLARSNTYAPSPRQYIDLIDLHRPPLSYGIVLGIDDRNADVIFAFSEPLKKIDRKAATTFHHVNFVTGLRMFMDIIRSRH